jgi:hypothetical protein
MSIYKEESNNINTGSRINAITVWLRNRIHFPGDRKQFMVHPCQIGGRPTLVYEKGLQTSDPEMFRHLHAYAAEQGYEIKEDRRHDFIEGVKRVKGKKSANVITIMVLSGYLLSSTAYADSTDEDEKTTNLKKFIDTASEQTQVMETLLSLNIRDKSDQPEIDLMTALLTWINNNSSFDYKLDELPIVNMVNSVEIAEIAFGKALPKAIDPDTLGIKGLYNFNNKTIYILDTMDLNTEGDRAILLHELVHFLQYQAGENNDVKCKNELELLAYRLEAKYLHSLNKKIDFDADHIANISQCK